METAFLLLGFMTLLLLAMLGSLAVVNLATAAARFVRRVLQ